MEYSKNNLNKVKRIPKRGLYEKTEIHRILDKSFLAHVSYIFEGYPICIPTAYGRENEVIYIHGAVKNRMMDQILSSRKVSLTVTHLHGLVLAKSTFHHSMNYESVVVFGSAEEVIDMDEKNHALKIITENILKGRWDETRLPNEKEMKITKVIKINIETASAKSRSGDPIDDEIDQSLNIWSGLLPLNQGFGKPVADSFSKNLEVPDSLKAFDS